MATIDVLNARMTALLQVSKECLTDMYMYFTMYYPGRSSGNMVQETGIEYGNRLPDQYNGATPAKLNDDDICNDTKILVVPVSIHAIDQALTEADSYSAVYSVFRNSVLDSEDLTGRKDTLSDPDYSFRFVFYTPNKNSPFRHVRLLLIARWTLFSKMHDWRPDAGIERLKQHIVVPMEDHMSEWVKEGGYSSTRFNREITTLLENSPPTYIQPHSVKRLFWCEEPFSSHLWLNRQMARLSPTSNIARLKVCRFSSLFSVQPAKRRALTSVQNVPLTPPVSPAASDYKSARSRPSPTSANPNDRGRTRSSSPTPQKEQEQCARCGRRSRFARSPAFRRHLSTCDADSGSFYDPHARACAGEQLIAEIEDGQ